MNGRPKIFVHLCIPKIIGSPQELLFVPLVNLLNEANTHRLGHCGSQLRVAAAVDATAVAAAPVAAAADR